MYYINMNTITLPRIKYNVLEKKATLYDRFLKRMSNTFFEVENYSPTRISEFLSQDKISSKTLKRVSKILS